MTATGFLHPGAMGATIAAACTGDSLWVSDGRTAATKARAERAELIDAGSIAALAQRADMIVAVCPPEAAEQVADKALATGFGGVYVDANAVSPTTARRIGDRFEHFVDGGIIGPPARQKGTTRLYLSGASAPAVADRFAGSVLDARVVDGGPGAASALKMAFAAWTKGTTALLFAIRALAETEDVTGPLLEEWALSHPDLAARSTTLAAATAPKAWRWVAEMREIADTFEAADLPGGFHEAAASVFEALAVYKDHDDVTIDHVIASLC